MNKKVNKKRFTSMIVFREAISFPFIWMMIFPLMALDLFLFIYQNTAIRLYGIPLAKRSDYIVYDRESLEYLNIFEKINCLYCSYANWLLSYAVEVAWRTEKYWCPIKHKKKTLAKHCWQEKFAEFWDEEKFREVYWNTKEFFENKN